MPAKLMQCTNLQLVILLTVVVLVSRPCALSATPRMNVAGSPSVQQMTGVELNDTQDKRYPRVRLLATTNDAEVSDERGLNLGSTVTKLKDMTTSGTQILKTFVTSNQQLQTDKLFKKFKVGTGEVNLFESPQFHNWFNSVRKLYKKNVEKGELAMVTTLITQYGDDAIPKLLIEANRASSTNIIARKLAEDQFTKWSADKMNVGSVFNLLKLDQAEDDIFKSPLLSTWVKYAYKIEKQPEETLFFALRSRFDDNILAKMLIAAKKDSSVAVNLEKVELEEWLRRGKSSDEVFKLLRLNRLNDKYGNLLENPTFNTWVSYVQKAKKESPYDIVFAKLLTHYDEERLTRMIFAARDDSKTRLIAEKLEVMQQHKWISGRKTAEDAFKLLKLEKEGDAIFNSPMWSSWNSYVLKVSKGDPNESMYLILRSQFGEEKLMKMIDAAQENRRTKNIADKLQEEVWRSEGKLADDIFKLLKLDEKKEKFFESPMVSTWISYVTKLEKLKVKSNEFGFITYLEKKFGEVKLAHILSMQNRVATKKKFITDLQRMQFKRWMTEDGLDPKRLDIILKQDTSKKVMPANVQVTLDFHAFYKANGGSPFYVYTKYMQCIGLGITI